VGLKSFANVDLLAADLVTHRFSFIKR